MDQIKPIHINNHSGEKAQSRTLIKTLKVDLLTENCQSFISCVPNSKEPTIFETEFFKGISMIYIRTNPIEKHLESFFVGKKRQFEVQVQGKFKRFPVGEVFVGAEATNKMELGIVTKAISKAAMKLCETMVADLHYSFGEAQSNPSYQLPHVVAPLFTTFDKIVVTPKGEEPPVLGIPFVEDPEYRKARMKFRMIEDANINLENTYSFSVNTSNLDLLSWNLVGIPMVKPMDLRTFFGNSSIQLVGYEIPKSVFEKVGNVHPNKLINYVFNMKLTPVSEEDYDLDLPYGNSSDDEGADEMMEENNDYVDTMQNISQGNGGRTRTSTAEYNEDNEDKDLDTPDNDEFENNFNTEKVEETTESSRGRRPSHSETLNTSELVVDDINYFDTERSASHRLGIETHDDSVLDYQIKASPNKGFNRFVFRGGHERSSLSAKYIPTTRASVSGNFNSSSRMSTGVGSGVSAWLRKHLQHHSNISHNTPDGAVDNSGGDHNDVYEYSEFQTTDYELESEGDRSFCPACIDLNDYRKDGRRRILYLIPLQQKPGYPTFKYYSLANTPWQNIPFRLKTLTELSKILPLVPLPPMFKTKKMSNAEKRRRQIIESYRTLCKPGNQSAWDRFQSYLSQFSETDAHFLCGDMQVKRREFNENKKEIKDQSLQSMSSFTTWEGSIALATSRRHWCEHYLVLHKTEAIFYRHSESRRVTSRISMDKIICVRQMQKEEVPFPGFGYFLIETFTRVYFCMVRSQKEVQDWIAAFINHRENPSIVISPYEDQALSQSHQQTSGKDRSISYSPQLIVNDSSRTIRATSPVQETNIAQSQHNPSALLSVVGTISSPTNVAWNANYHDDLQSNNVEPNEAYMAKSACWKLDKKRIFNYRKIVFHYPEKYEQIHPCELVEGILKLLFYFTESETNRWDKALWIKFLDEISYLQMINLSVLTERERLVFFLNLYHSMVLHGHLIFGAHPSWNFWNSSFHTINYIVAYELISIAEIEHNIIRANMGRPSTFTRVIIPNSVFPGLSINHRDFRLFFCVNNGSNAMPSTVPIYKVKTIDSQLDEMTFIMLSESIEIDQMKKTVVIPKIPLQDFSPKKNTTLQPLECLRVLLYYLKRDKKQLVMKLIAEHGSHLNIRFKTQNTTCGTFKMYESKVGVN